MSSWWLQLWIGQPGGSRGRSIVAVLYDPMTHVLEGHVMGPEGRFVPLAPDANGELPVEVLGLSLGLRAGDQYEEPGPFLRWIDRDGQTVPLGRERAEKERERANQERERANQERERAVQEHQLVERERDRAEQERERAEQERARAEDERQRAERADVRAEEERARREAVERRLAELEAVLAEPER